MRKERQIPAPCCPQEPCFTPEGAARLTEKRQCPGRRLSSQRLGSQARTNIYSTDLNPKKGSAARPHRFNFRTKAVTGAGERERHFTLINRPLNQEAVTILNMYAQNISASKSNGAAKDRDRKARRQIYGDCWKSQPFSQQLTGHRKSVKIEKSPTIAPINLT